MRRQFVVVVVAVATMISLAFLVPLARLVDRIAEDRGINLAEDEAASLARSVSLVDATDLTVLDSLVAVGDPDASRSIILGSGVTIGSPSGSPEAIEAARAGRSGLYEELGGTAAYVPVVGSENSPVARAFVAGDVLDRNVRQAWAALAGLGVALIAIGALLADRLARSIVRPVEALAGAAHSMAEGDLSARVKVEGPDELQMVSGVFNRLGDRLQHLLQAEREAVADISHRLRTPLTALQLEVEQLPDGESTDRVRESVSSMQRQVDYVIQAVRRPIVDRTDSVADLAAVVRERCEFWEALTTDEGRAFSVDVPSHTVRVVGDEEDLAAAMDALVGNVISHTDEGVPLWVSVTAAPPTLVVADAGPGFPDDSVVQRGVSDGGSTGLGLDIARRTVEDCGGTMRIGTRPEGGALVELRFQGVR
jgi:signal transduction histidine kinase